MGGGAIHVEARGRSASRRFAPVIVHFIRSLFSQKLIRLRLKRPPCAADSVSEVTGGSLPGIQIGQLLIEQGVLTEKQVEHILKVQKMSHRPFGDLAERRFGINPQAVEDAWVQQYVRLAGTIDLKDQEIDEECLRLL